MSATFSTPRVQSEQLADGRLLLRSTEPLAEHPISVVHSFRAHSEATPGRVLVAERGPGGGWQTSTWGEVRQQADRLAQGLLDRGLADRPVMVLSGNSRLHLAVTLAAMTVGAPIVPSSVAYSLQSADHAKLRAMADLVEPGLIVAEDSSYATAVAAVGEGRPVISGDGALTPDVFGADPTEEVDRRCAAIQPTDVAKILFTSGSTGTPKGVLTTHGMLAANQQQMLQAWPFLAEEPPVLLDWLPWSHTFGGNFCTGLVLTHGASSGSTTAAPPRPWSIGRCATSPTCTRPSTSTCRPGGRRSCPTSSVMRPRRPRSSTGCGSASSPLPRCRNSSGTASRSWLRTTAAACG